jgi:bis(5'-nucleosyl)-tetraphosphatase (symmetrical)
VRLVDQLPRDSELRFAGDLVNRGPASLATLRYVRGLGSRAECVLGNHDLHFLAVYAGVRAKGKSDTLDELLAADDCAELVDWLRHRPLALLEDGYLMVHAGVLPQWSTAQVVALAREVECQLRGDRWQEFLAGIFGDGIGYWQDGLAGKERHRIVINALTRLRYCTADGAMDFKSKDGPGKAPPGFMPWFDVPGRLTSDTTVVCGHWSTLGLVVRDHLIALDTGCVWGGKLSAARMASRPDDRTIIQTSCRCYQDPKA